MNNRSARLERFFTKFGYAVWPFLIALWAWDAFNSRVAFVRIICTGALVVSALLWGTVLVWVVKERRKR